MTLLASVDEMNGTSALILTVIAILTALFSWLKWLRPRYRKAQHDGVAIRDAILGRDAVVDSITGKELAPALPGIGQRMAHQEQQMTTMTNAVAQLAETHAQLIEVNRSLVDHESRLQKLEAAAVERVVTRAESAAAWRAMEAAHKAQPEVDADVIEPDNL